MTAAAENVAVRGMGAAILVGSAAASWIACGPVGLGFVAAAAAGSWAASRGSCGSSPITPQSAQSRERDWIGAVERANEDWRKLLADRSPQIDEDDGPDWTGYAERRSGVSREHLDQRADSDR